MHFIAPCLLFLSENCPSSFHILKSRDGGDTLKYASWSTTMREIRLLLIRKKANFAPRFLDFAGGQMPLLGTCRRARRTIANFDSIGPLQPNNSETGTSMRVPLPGSQRNGVGHYNGGNKTQQPRQTVPH
jgi:hypothetical protein